MELDCNLKNQKNQKFLTSDSSKNDKKKEKMNQTTNLSK